jgi:hypothetical protein
VSRSAQDDDFVGVLKKNIPSKLALMGLRPTQADENALCSATILYGSFALPFVIPTEAYPDFLSRSTHDCHACGFPQRKARSVIQH